MIGASVRPNSLHADLDGDGDGGYWEIGGYLYREDGLIGEGFSSRVYRGVDSQTRSMPHMLA